MLLVFYAGYPTATVHAFVTSETHCQSLYICSRGLARCGVMLVNEWDDEFRLAMGREILSAVRVSGVWTWDLY